MTNKNLSKKGIAMAVAGVLVAAAAGAGLHELADNDVQLNELIAEKQAQIESLNSSLSSSQSELSETITSKDGVISDLEAELDVANGRITELENVEPVIEKVIDERADTIVDVLSDYEDVDLLDDLDEDEVTVEVVAERAAFIVDAINLAEAEVSKNIVEFIDDEEDIFGEGDLEDYRDNDVYKVKIDEDDTVFDSYDFEDNEATLLVEADLKLKNDDEKKTITVIAEVEIEDGKAEIVDVELKE